MFLIFFCSGRGRGESEAARRPGVGGGWFFIENPRGLGVSRRAGDEGPGECRWRIGILGGRGGVRNIFFRGRNVHQVIFLALVNVQMALGQMVVPGLTGPKSLCVRLETQEI